ncbi:MAG: DUF790 family protein [Proteobacteria bacterium]|nr:DUF790 family protein [Pseudomonadota bacterium]
MIASRSPALLDAQDATWLATLCAAAAATAGQPWRVLEDRVASVVPQLGHPRVRPRDVLAVLGAFRQLMAGPSTRKLARTVRARVLGTPVFDAAARTTRITDAATALGRTPAELEQLLWSDLSRERLVMMPVGGRLDPLAVAELANVELVARVLRRALAVTLVVRGDPRELARLVARCGLLATISTRGQEDDTTTFAIVGPLALFHTTTVYGRAIAAIVPRLAGRDFSLTVTVDDGAGPGTVALASPILLPPANPASPPVPVATRALVATLEAAGHVVERDPAPITSGTRVLFPDLVVDGRPLEIIGFATAAYLADKRAAYLAANHDPIFEELSPRRSSRTRAASTPPPSRAP